jgi:hypothetical protein
VVVNPAALTVREVRAHLALGGGSPAHAKEVLAFVSADWSGRVKRCPTIVSRGEEIIATTLWLCSLCDGSGDLSHDTFALLTTAQSGVPEAAIIERQRQVAARNDVGSRLPEARRIASRIQRASGRTIGSANATVGAIELGDLLALVNAATEFDRRWELVARVLQTIDGPVHENESLSVAVSNAILRIYSALDTHDDSGRYLPDLGAALHNHASLLFEIGRTTKRCPFLHKQFVILRTWFKQKVLV